MSTEEKVLFEKEGLKFSKLGPTHYCTTFFIKNDNIRLADVINFDLIKLMYDLNPDIYEFVQLEKLGDTDAKCLLILKHFFEDLGLPQRYAYLHMRKSFVGETIIFEASSDYANLPENIPESCKPTAIKNVKSVCEIITTHEIRFTHNIYFNEANIMPIFVEKMVGAIIHKIFKRVKQFIESVRV
jgi:hypothetical protein